MVREPRSRQDCFCNTTVDHQRLWTGVHSLAISHNGSIAILHPSVSSDPFSHPTCFLLHMTLIHHCRNETSLYCCPVLSACRDFAQRWHRTCWCTRPCDCLLWFRRTSPSLASSELATHQTLSSDLVIRIPAVFSPQPIGRIGHTGVLIGLVPFVPFLHALE